MITHVYLSPLLCVRCSRNTHTHTHKHTAHAIYRTCSIRGPSWIVDGDRLRCSQPEMHTPRRSYSYAGPLSTPFSASAARYHPPLRYGETPAKTPLKAASLAWSSEWQDTHPVTPLIPLLYRLVKVLVLGQFAWDRKQNCCKFISHTTDQANIAASVRFLLAPGFSQHRTLLISYTKHQS